MTGQLSMGIRGVVMMYKIDYENETVTVEVTNELISIFGDCFDDQVEEPMVFPFNTLKWLSADVWVFPNWYYATFSMALDFYGFNNFDEYTFIGEYEIIKRMFSDFKKIMEATK